MSLGNPHQTTANLGDLVIVVTANGKHTNKTGMRLWFECEVATVVGIGEARRIKAVLFARDWRVERRADLANLVALVPFPAAQIDVPLAMMAARKHGQPFGSLEEVRAAVHPFVLVDLVERGYDPVAGEGAARDADAATEAFVDAADAERDALRDEYVNAPEAQAGPVFKPHDLVNVCDPKHKHFGTRGNVVGVMPDSDRVVVEYDNHGNTVTVAASQLMHYSEFVKQPDEYFEAAERTTLAEQLRAHGAEQAAQDAEADAFHAQRRADEAEANGEHVDYAEAEAVREIEEEMALEAAGAESWDEL